jgi:hypothetical protein
MNVSQIMQHIHTVEQTLPVHEWRYRGIQIWPILRTKLYFDLFNKYNFTDTTPLSQKTISALQISIRSIPDFLRFLFYIVFTVKKDVVCFADASYVLRDEKYYQRFIDPEIEFLNANAFSTVTITASDITNKNLTNPTYKLNILRLVTRILAKFYSRIIKTDVNLKDFDKYNEYLEKIEIGSISNKVLAYTLWQYWVTSKIYQFILKRISPKAALIVSYYEGHNMSFVHACRKLGIPVADIQHGVINDHHACYGGWRHIPVTGYNTMPNIFTCWEKQSTDCINNWAQKTNGAHIAVHHGNKYMQLVLNENNPFKKIYNEFNKINSPEYNILLSLQTNYELNDFLETVLKISPQNYFWWIRFHPMLTDLEKDKIAKRISVIPNLRYESVEATNNTLYNVLPLMSAHITLNSSVVVEASEMGIRSIICEETGYIYYKHYIDHGDAYIAKTPEEAIKLISQLKKEPTTPSFPAQENLYKKLGIIKNDK